MHFQPQWQGMFIGLSRHQSRKTERNLYNQSHYCFRRLSERDFLTCHQTDKAEISRRKLRRVAGKGVHTQSGQTSLERVLTLTIMERDDLSMGG